jgi:hypothetical protein
MWQQVNEVMLGPKLVCSGLSSAISKCVEYVVDAFVLVGATCSDHNKNQGIHEIGIMRKWLYHNHKLSMTMIAKT